jgi:hypothetical protein
MESFSRIDTLRLYRNIIKSAKVFPSIKRNKILAEIRLEFRENKSITDPEKRGKFISIAIKGLEQLSMYSDLPKASSNWTVNLDKNPMPSKEKS